MKDSGRKTYITNTLLKYCKPGADMLFLIYLLLPARLLFLLVLSLPEYKAEANKRVQNH